MMKQQTATNAIVSNDATDVHHHSKKSYSILICVLVVILLVAIYYLGKSNKKTTPPQLSTTALINEVNEDNAAKHYNSAIDLIKSQKNYNSPEDQIMLATVYNNEGDFTKALAIYSVLDQEDALNQASLEQAADTAAQDKQNALAIKYYQQAITASKTNTSDPLASSDATYDQQQINTLQQGSQ